jgi:hypothetical protein
MNSYKLTALLFALALPAAVLAQSNDAAKPNPHVEKAIIKIEHDMSAALTKPEHLSLPRLHSAPTRTRRELSR